MFGSDEARPLKEWTCFFVPKSSCERLCEVEFWEVLRLEMYKGVFAGVTLKCHRLTAN
jgi:hypothetical protein